MFSKSFCSGISSNKSHNLSRQENRKPSQGLKLAHYGASSYCSIKKMIDKYKSNGENIPINNGSIHTNYQNVSTINIMNRKRSNSPNFYTSARRQPVKQNQRQNISFLNETQPNSNTRSETHSLYSGNSKTSRQNSKLNQQQSQQRRTKQGNVDRRFGYQLFNEQLYEEGAHKISLIDIINAEPMIYQDSFHTVSQTQASFQEHQKIPKVIESLVKSHKEHKESLSFITHKMEFIEHYLNSYVFEDLIMKMNNKFEKMLSYTQKREQIHQQTEIQMQEQIKQLETKLMRLQVSFSSYINKLNINNGGKSQILASKHQSFMKKMDDDGYIDQLLTDVMQYEEDQMRRVNNVEKPISISRHYYSQQCLGIDQRQKKTNNNQAKQTQVIDLSDHHLTQRDYSVQDNEQRDLVHDQSCQQDFIKDETTMFNALKSFGDSSTFQQLLPNQSSFTRQENELNNHNQKHNIISQQALPNAYESNENLIKIQGKKNLKFNRVISLQNLEFKLEQLSLQNQRVNNNIQTEQEQNQEDNEQLEQNINHNISKDRSGCKKHLDFQDSSIQKRSIQALGNETSQGMLSEISDNYLNFTANHEMQYKIQCKDQIMPHTYNTQDVNKLITPKFDDECVIHLNQVTFSNKSRFTESIKISDEPQINSGKIRQFDNKNNNQQAVISEEDSNDVVISALALDINKIMDSDNKQRIKGKDIANIYPSDQCICPHYDKKNNLGCGDYCRNLTASRQRVLIQKCFADFKNQQRNKRQQHVYIISAKWWRKWTDFVNYDAIVSSFRVGDDKSIQEYLMSSDGQMNEFDIDELCGDSRYNEPPSHIDNRQLPTQSNSLKFQ
ncbi:ubiquitin carboxyl-terminal hydrolase [Stylonychia lemnae]|uniref:Ubiquitin carboxyl-terminal hydrolase n=1 Tax=Stylonychia lemnae TaxID=5949 RepID=A0A078ANS9_STYLE|nr:ubiquitin carboxyl-terminal hydrolase [Stylonychia lemnae]|eukprot:CDW82962.1 ubiquitin carboxyl-terminal hydrolase [Stylonychia lemnae]